MDTTPTLTPQQQRFCDAYLNCNNATQAATEAGYSWKTANSGYLLKHAGIRAYLADKRAQLVLTRRDTADLMLDQLAAIAFSNMGDYFNADGSFKKPAEMDATAQTAVKEMTFNTIEYKNKEGRTVVMDHFSLKMHDKVKALARLLASPLAH